MRKSKRYKNMIWVLLVVLVVAVFFVQDKKQKTEPKTEETQQREMTVQIADKENINETGINEDMSIYEKDDPESLAYFYVTVRKGDVGSKTDHTFAEVNNAVRFVNYSHVANNVYARALVQVGDEYGPQPGMLGYGSEKTNATIRIRGNSTSLAHQKSYQLKLDEEAGLWRGQENIALNKSVYDMVRFRNKLYFDLLKKVEDVPSIRTQFARLFIKDETSGETEFKDYGFFTQLEVPNKKYLANHGLDRDGYLYKAIGFNFEPKEALRNFDDPKFNKDEFIKIVDCKGREDNQRLIDLVNKVSDFSIDINEIVGPYIDKENYLSWLAYNILVGNTDSTVQNYYLYSPLNGQKWYFIPWDGDGMLGRKESELAGVLDNMGPHEKGISNYWGVLLHNRFLKKKENRDALTEKIEELHAVINKETVDEYAKKLNETVLPYVSQMPDINHLSGTLEERKLIVDTLGDEVEIAYQNYYRSLESLMPYFLYPVESGEQETELVWEEAYDFDNEEIEYELYVSQYPDMRVPVIHKKIRNITSYTASKEELPKGTYYWTVKACSTSGKIAQPMNKINVSGEWYPGVDVVEVF